MCPECHDVWVNFRSVAEVSTPFLNDNPRSSEYVDTSVTKYAFALGPASAITRLLSVRVLVSQFHSPSALSYLPAASGVCPPAFGVRPKNLCNPRSSICNQLKLNPTSCSDVIPELPKIWLQFPLAGAPARAWQLLVALAIDSQAREVKRLQAGPAGRGQRALAFLDFSSC
jgi:hypothetical protein